MDAVADAARQEADGIVATAQANLSEPSLSARRRGDCAGQYHPSRLGAVLCVWSLESLLLVRPRLGGKEDAEPLGAGAPTSRLWVDAVAQSVAVRRPRAIL